MGYDDEQRVVASKIEARFVGFAVAVAGTLGYLWLQNTFTSLEKIRAELAEARASIEQTYAPRDMVKMVDERVTRIEERLEARAARIEEAHQRIIGDKTGGPHK